MFDAGVSVYLGLDDYPFDKVISYLRTLKSYNIKYVFSSFHMGEANNSLDVLEKFIDIAKEEGLKLSLDVSRKVINDRLINSNIYSLRLDYGFSDEEIVELSNKRIIELNASTIKEEKLKRLIDLGLNTSNTRFSFNFYPKPHTGHDLSFVYEKTQLLKSYGLYVSVFIPSHKNFRPPLYLGLPTIEEHRMMDLDIAIEELKLCGVDGIYYGDSLIDKEEIDILLRHNTDEILVKLDSSIDSLYNKIVYNRIDGNSLLIRLNGLKLEGTIEPDNTIDRKRFDVTVDNVNMKRYMGEVNIVLQNLPNSDSVNVVGKVITSDFILDELKKSIKFKFIK